jgi:hypothetical protein
VTSGISELPDGFVWGPHGDTMADAAHFSGVMAERGLQEAVVVKWPEPECGDRTCLEVRTRLAARQTDLPTVLCVLAGDAAVLAGPIVIRNVGGRLCWRQDDRTN